MPDDELLQRLKTALANRYDVEQELGHGGMAIVYLARDLKHDRSVALKVMRPELTTSLGGERFLREISIAAKLSFPTSSRCTIPVMLTGCCTTSCRSSRVSHSGICLTASNSFPWKTPSESPAKLQMH